jgi:hypothetical protein
VRGDVQYEILPAARSLAAIHLAGA